MRPYTPRVVSPEVADELREIALRHARKYLEKLRGGEREGAHWYHGASCAAYMAAVRFGGSEALEWPTFTSWLDALADGPVVGVIG